MDPVLLSLRSVLCFRKGWPSSQLARRHVIFECAGLSQVDQDLLIASLLLSEFSSRVARGISNPRMDLWLNADEAARLISAHHFAGGLSEFIRLARGVGIGVDLSGQVADVSPAVLSNTANRFIGRVTSSLDLEVIGSSMGLTAEQRRYVFHTLTPGQFIAQIGTGEWRRPFVLRIPKLNLSGAAPSECDERPDVALPALPSEPVRT